MKTKKGKSHKEPHVMDTKHGMGDYYGTGFKNPVGKMRDSSYPGIRPVNKKQLKTPPKSVV